MPLIQVAALNIWFVPMHLIAFWFQDRLLIPRSARVLWATRALTLLITLMLDDRVINPSSVVSILLTALVITLLCFVGPMRMRLFTSALLVISAAVAELGGTTVWLVLAPGMATSSYSASWLNYPAHMAGMTTATLIEAAYLVLMWHAWRAAREEMLRDAGGEEGGCPACSPPTPSCRQRSSSCSRRRP